MLSEAPDAEIAKLAKCLQERRLPVCVDIRRKVEEQLSGAPVAERGALVTLACQNIENAIKTHALCAPGLPDRILLDRAERSPYKRFDGSKAPLNRILIRSGSGAPQDMADVSPLIAGAKSFSILRAYVFRDDSAAKSELENIMRTEIEGVSHGNA